MSPVVCWSTDSLPCQILPKTSAATVPILTTTVNRMSAEQRPLATGVAAAEYASIAYACVNARNRGFRSG